MAKRQRSRSQTSILEQLFGTLIPLTAMQYVIANAGGTRRSMGECWWTAPDLRGVAGIIDETSSEIGAAFKFLYD